MHINQVHQGWVLQVKLVSYSPVLGQSSLIRIKKSRFNTSKISTVNGYSTVNVFPFSVIAFPFGLRAIPASDTVVGTKQGWAVAMLEYLLGDSLDSEVQHGIYLVACGFPGTQSITKICYFLTSASRLIARIMFYLVLTNNTPLYHMYIITSTGGDIN